ncbi:DUF5335 family protein [Streptomyces sp. JJ36]|uniref:DUF5335 family protein n=1 Tax=Streptomyces sp. JJ36 TaxID=2736645 RepID=UPI001F2FE460|nr:DUF5335 family protein [Streptomyces sp. JJ36]MCF6523630.1 DUF5335 family protein [Streptomyces sp. JJ36]
MTGSGALERTDWQTALEEITDEHWGHLVSIEVLDPSLGDQYEAERLPFSSLAYDPKDDVVIVAVGGKPPRYPVVLRHMVPHPAEIDVAVRDAAEDAVRVVPPEGAPTLITFHRAESGPAA